MEIEISCSFVKMQLPYQCKKKHRWEIDNILPGHPSVIVSPLFLQAIANWNRHLVSPSCCFNHASVSKFRWSASVSLSLSSKSLWISKANCRDYKSMLFFPMSSFSSCVLSFSGSQTTFGALLPPSEMECGAAKYHLTSS